MYSRVSSLQQLLASREALARTLPEVVRLGALECLAHLSLSHGRALASGMPETASLAVKHSARYVIYESSKSSNLQRVAVGFNRSFDTASIF